jgi:thiol-disulfide isomerase/thioredoxin
VLLLAMLVVSVGAMPAAALKLGDPAPPLKQGQYVQGEPVETIEDGKVYVVEFWATWCGPCVDAIPHVNALQEQYADQDVIMIGQNVWEDDTSAVPAFVQRMGDDMGYRVALDDDDQMAETWMQAAGQNGIPAAFIVDRQGKLAWIGHPMGMDEPLAKIVEGTYDIEAEAKRQAMMERLQQEVGAAMQAGDVDRAVKLLDDAAPQLPADLRANLPLDKFMMYASADRMEEGYAVLREMVQASSDADLLSAAAWMLVEPDSPVQDPDLDLALSAAQKATGEGDTPNPDHLDTLARVHHARGDQALAIDVQQQALAAAEQQEAAADFVTYLREVLAEYRGE